ncbi:MAG: type III-B CRISPR module RAMP protein Cmr6, partial [Chloracidobacterium sp.]|nr:type III-B CRISPR module RAMP protein Cmr6 [Chloracidobacterium sp.]
SILETNICLHRIYGFPILPGSALKGLARTYGLFQIAEKLGVPPLPLDVCNERKANKIPTPLEKLEQYLLSEEDKDKNHWLEQLKKDDALAVDAPLRQMNLKQMDETELNGKGIRVKDWRLIFGAMGQKGKVIFFDAIPGDLADLTLDLDVMNPHYAPYYQGNEPPADYHNPVPIFFLTI